jgi:hypothetical protein
MTSANHPGGLLPPPPPGRNLPHHDRHRRELLAVVGSERTAGRRRLAAAWLAPAGAGLAVLVVVAAVFVLSGLVGGAKPGGKPSGGGAGTASSAPAAATGGRHGQPIERTERALVSQAVTGLAVRDSVGAVRITGADTTTVSITAHLVYRGTAPVVSRRITGGVLDLGYTCPASSRNCGVAFDLVVPRGLGVTVQLEVGQISLRGLAGPVSVHTGVGQIQGSGLSGPRIRLTTGTGMISAGFSAPPRQIVASSGVGAVTVRVPGGAVYRVSASTQVGSVRVTVPRADTSGHVIQASTGAGVVAVIGN